MSRYFKPLMPLVFAVAVPAAFAWDSDTCLTTEGTPVCRHYFEGQRIDLPVQDILDEIESHCGGLVVHVFQRQGTLLAPLAKPIPLDDPACETMPALSLDLPDVRAETDILVRFSQGGDSGAEAEIVLRIYPDTLLEPLARLAEQHSLVVHDDEGVLSRFLEDNAIAYVQGFETSFGKPISLFAGPTDAQRLLEDSSVASAVIFHEAVVDLPQVRTVSANGLIRVYVEMPVLQDLRDSPLAQKAFLKIIRLAIDPGSIDRG